MNKLLKQFFFFRNLFKALLFFLLTVLFSFIYVDFLDAYIDDVMISGQLADDEKILLQDVISDYLYDKPLFFSVDVSNVSLQIRSDMNWIDEILIRKQWPNVLDLRIKKHEVIARWCDDDFFAANGKIIDQPCCPPASLPLLCGLDKHQAQLFDLQHTLVILLQDSPLQLKSILVDSAAQCTVTFMDGSALLLGSTDWEERLNRFSVIYHHSDLSNRLTPFRADARHRKGVAFLLLDDAI